MIDLYDNYDVLIVIKPIKAKSDFNYKIKDNFN